MKLLVTDDHEGEGDFPVFLKGTLVTNSEPCKESLHWMACTIRGMKTYVADVFVENGQLITDYAPTELVLFKGDIVNLEKVVYEWLYVETANGIFGWFPANKVRSIFE